MPADPKTPRDLTAEQWRALAHELEESAEEMAAEGRHAVVWRAKVAAHALRAMAFGCGELDVDQLFPRAPSDRKSLCRFEVKARHWATDQPRQRGRGLTLTAALLDAAGEG